MNKLFKFILPIGIVPILASCGGKPSSDVTHYVTFHQELADDVKIEFHSYTTDGEIIAQEPKIVAKDGYDAKWEDYTVVGKTADFTVNAIYDAYTYTVTFKQKGLVVDTVPFTAADVKGDHPQLPAEKVPACPSDTWYTYEWEDYELKLGDVVVNAISTGEITHIAKFTDGDKVIKDDFPFGRKDVVNGKLKEEIIPTQVNEYKHDETHPTYWDNNWDFTIPTGSDINVTFDANVTKHNFKLKFVDFDGEQIGDLVDYQYDSKWEDIVKPAVPAKTGYTTGWPTKVTLELDYDNPQTIQPIETANTYTITFRDHPDSPQTVTYGQPYELNFKSETDNDLKMFYDSNNQLVPTEGVWNIANDVNDLHLVETKEINFDSGYIPKIISSDDQLSIGNDPKENGKVLQIDISNPGTDTTFMQLSKDYLENMFKDESVVAICFDAIATKDNNEMRCTYCAPQTAGGTRTANWCYENNDYRWGVRSAVWKTFTFKKAYMNNYPTNFHFLYGKFADETNPQTIWIKNIRPVTQIPDSYGFECGAVDGLTFKTAGHSQNACSDYEAPVTIFTTNSTSTVKSFAYDSTYKTEGNNSLHVVKENNYSQFSLSSAAYNSLGDHGYVDVDIRSDVAVNSKDPEHAPPSGVANFLDNRSTSDPSNVGYIADVDHPELVGNYQHPANQWVTYRFKVENNGIGRDGRFLIIQGSSGGNWWFDNIRLVHVD